MSALEFESVSLTRGNRRIFEGLSLQLSGPRVGVVGRNGSGKSQLLRLAAGLIAPTQGSVRIAGQDIAKERKAALSLVGVIFQNPEHQIIFPTVEEELAFGLKNLKRSDIPARISEVLARFGWQDRREQSIQSLSHGQKQLLCLMSVLAMEPDWIVLDEPMSGLDHVTRYRLQSVLDALPQNLLHVTHELEALEGYERVLWIEGGQVLADGPADEILPRYRAEMKAEAARDALPHR